MLLLQEMCSSIQIHRVDTFGWCPFFIFKCCNCVMRLISCGTDLKQCMAQCCAWHKMYLLHIWNKSHFHPLSFNHRSCTPRLINVRNRKFWQFFLFGVLLYSVMSIYRSELSCEHAWLGFHSYSKDEEMFLTARWFTDVIAVLGHSIITYKTLLSSVLTRTRHLSVSFTKLH